MYYVGRHALFINGRSCNFALKVKKIVEYVTELCKRVSSNVVHFGPVEGPFCGTGLFVRARMHVIFNQHS